MKHGNLAGNPALALIPRREAGISLRALIPRNYPASAWLTRAAPVLVRLLGIQTLDRIYRRHHLQGLASFEFAA